MCAQNDNYTKINHYVERLLQGSTPDMPLWNIESIRGGKEPHWNYIDGCMITALLLSLIHLSAPERQADL